MSAVLCVVCPRVNARDHSLPRNYCTQRRCGSNKLSSKPSFSSGVSAYSRAVANLSRSSEERVYEVVLKQAALVRDNRRESELDLRKPVENDGPTTIDWNRLNEAYERCRKFCADYDNTFYLGMCTCSLYLSMHFILGFNLLHTNYFAHAPKKQLKS